MYNPLTCRIGNDKPSQKDGFGIIVSHWVEVVARPQKLRLLSEHRLKKSQKNYLFVIYNTSCSVEGGEYNEVYEKCGKSAQNGGYAPQIQRIRVCAADAAAHPNRAGKHVQHIVGPLSHGDGKIRGLPGRGGAVRSLCHKAHLGNGQCTEAGGAFWRL